MNIVNMNSSHFEIEQDAIQIKNMKVANRKTEFN